MNFLIKFRLPILVVIAISQIFSPVLFVPGAEGFGGSVFRVVLLLLGVSIFISSGFRQVHESIHSPLIVGGLLFLWLSVSLSWSEDIASGVRHISYIGTTLLLIFILDALVRSLGDFLFFARLMALLGVVVAAFAFYEIETGIHYFVSSIQLDAERDQSLSYMTQDLAWLTFGNPNDLAVHVTLCSLMGLLFLGIDKRYTAISLLFLVIGLYLSFQLGARLAIVAVPIFIAVLATALPQRQASITALLATLASVTGATLVMLSLVFIEEAEFFDVSTFIRLQLISSGVEMAARTFFLGIGVGGFETEMWIRGLVGQTYGIINPHNAIARMLAENGAIGVALYGYLLFGPILTISRAGPNSRVAAFTAAMAVSLPLLLSAGSDPMSSSSLQLAIAFVWISCRVAVELGRDAASDAPPPSKAANLKEAFS